MKTFSVLIGIFALIVVPGCERKQPPKPQYEEIVIDDSEYELDREKLLRVEEPGGRLTGEVKVTSSEGLIGLQIQVGTKTDTKNIFHTAESGVRGTAFDEQLPPGELMFFVSQTGGGTGTIKFHQKIVITPHKP